MPHPLTRSNPFGPRPAPRISFASPAGAALVSMSLAVSIVVAPPAGAQAPRNLTPAEVQQLPPYCPDTELLSGHKHSPRRSPRASHWESLMGDGFWALHHYCYGLVALNRLRFSAETGSRREFIIHQIIAEYYYVINNVPSTFVLLPEIWTRIGEAELLRANYGAAYNAYLKARELKPDYWPAYTQWAELLLSVKKSDDARKLIEEGLRYAPDAEPLRAMFSRLGGNPSRIVPVPRAPAALPAVAARSASSAAAAAPPAAQAPPFGAEQPVSAPAAIQPP